MFLRLLLLSIILVIFGQTSLVNSVREVSARAANPLQYGAYRFSQNLKREFDFITDLRRLRMENLKLNEEVFGLESRLTAFKELEQENKLLKEQLGLEGSTVQQKLILVEIVGRSARGGEAVLVVDQGSSADIREGAAVVFKNFLLGEVFQIEPRRARVRLLTDSQFSAAALDQDSPDRTRGLVTGQYGTALTLQKVLPTEPLAVGDTIITSGEDGKFKKGLILGTIKKVLGQEANVFKSAELDLMIDFDSLEEVFVVR